MSFRTVGSSDRLLIASLGEVFMVAPIWLLVAEVPAGAIVAAMAVSGLANGIANPPVHAIYTLRTPRAVRTKVWSVVIAATAVIAPLAIAGAGAVLETAGFRPVILALVAVQTLAAIAFTTAGLRERARTRREVVLA